MEDKKIIDIGVAEYYIDGENTKIETSGIGSCLVICLYDEETKQGGMAHCMLPGKVDEKLEFVSDKPEKKAKYVEDAIDLMVSDLKKRGVKVNNLKAKLVGGAEMFTIFSERKRNSLGDNNINSARNKLSSLKIPIVSEDTGGSIGRSASFNLDSGVLTVSVKM